MEEFHLIIITIILITSKLEEEVAIGLEGVYYLGDRKYTKE